MSLFGDQDSAEGGLETFSDTFFLIQWTKDWQEAILYNANGFV